jgi:hypothetical protein
MLAFWSCARTGVSVPATRSRSVAATPSPSCANARWRRRSAKSLTVATEILRVLRGARPAVLGNPKLWPRLGHLDRAPA